MPDQPPIERLSLLVELEPGEDLAQLRLEAERYRYLRERAVRIQGSNLWYSGDFLDIRVDVGLGRRPDDEPT